MKLRILFLALLMAITAALLPAQSITFNQDTVGRPPQGFSMALTGKGNVGNWVVIHDETAPSKPNVLAQTDMDKTDYRFPLCIFDSLIARDVDISVKFKPVRGSVDQAGGIVWRYKDKDNYYLIRTNANEDNVVLYKVKNGKRTDLPLVDKGRTYGVKEKVPSGEWGTLRLVAKGNHFEAYHNDKKLFEVKDSTFTGAGKVGLWTKADSYTLFDDLIIHALDEKIGDSRQ